MKIKLSIFFLSYHNKKYMQDTYLTKTKQEKPISYNCAYTLKRKQITLRMSANHALKAKKKETAIKKTRSLH